MGGRRGYKVIVADLTNRRDNPDACRGLCNTTRGSSSAARDESEEKLAERKQDRRANDDDEEARSSQNVIWIAHVGSPRA